MPGYRARARDVRDRVFAAPVHQTAAETSNEVARAVLPELAELRRALAELQRIMGDQGDAADEIAEITGRALSRLSDEIVDLRADVAGLQAAVRALQPLESPRHDAQ